MKINIIDNGSYKSIEFLPENEAEIWQLNGLTEKMEKHQIFYNPLLYSSYIGTCSKVVIPVTMKDENA